MMQEVLIVEEVLEVLSHMESKVILMVLQYLMLMIIITLVMDQQQPTLMLDIAQQIVQNLLAAQKPVQET
jgi:hypothetical protein